MIEIVSVFLDPIPEKPRILAFVHFKLGPVIVKDVKVLLTNDGRNVVVLPEKANLRPCVGCASKCAARDKYCHNCGEQLPKLRGLAGFGRSIVQAVDHDAYANLSFTILRAYCDEVLRQRRASFAMSLSA